MAGSNCRWRNWRLLAIDGIQFSLYNTPQNHQKLRKAKSRRGRAAFAKVGASVLLEVGLHNPLAAAIGQDGRSEWELSRSLLAQLPKGVLLLADRLHGCAAFAVQVSDACARVGSHFLIRARSNIKARTVRRLKDGSRLVEVPVRAKGSRKLLRHLTLREITVRVGRPGIARHGCGGGPRCSIRRRRPPSSWSSCIVSAGNTNCTIAK